MHHDQPQFPEETDQSRREPTAPRPRDSADSSDTPRVDDGPQTISGYWLAPTIRDLDDLSPQRRDDLSRPKPRRQRKARNENTEVAQLARLADDAKRFHQGLSRLVARLTGDSSGEPFSDVESEYGAPLKKSNRIFRPGGLVVAPSPEFLAPHFRRGRIVFPCPACKRVAELYSTSAGKPARCPKCYSAIIAPHPRKGIDARNMEDDPEMLAQPEAYQVEVPPPRRASISWFRLPGAAEMIKACGILVLGLFAVKIYLLGFEANSAYEIRNNEFHGQAEKTSARVDHRVRAQEIVKAFFKAGTWEEKASLVRHHEAMIPAMKLFYREHPGQMEGEYLSVEARAPGYYADGALTHLATEVAVQFRNFDLAILTVEHLPEGDLIEWETSVGYNPVGWEEWTQRARENREGAVLRVLASFDDYYNFGYRSDRYHCLRLLDPGDHSVLGYGYLERGSEDAREAIHYLREADSDHPKRLIVELGFVESAIESRQVVIRRLVQTGWRTDVVMSPREVAPEAPSGPAEASPPRLDEPTSNPAGAALGMPISSVEPSGRQVEHGHYTALSIDGFFYRSTLKRKSSGRRRSQDLAAAKVAYPAVAASTAATE